MTDMPALPVRPEAELAIPNRLGAYLTVDGPADLDHVVGVVTPRPETIHHGALRASVVTFVIDAAAGLVIDTDPDTWSFTSDLTLRLPPRRPPDRLEVRSSTLRAGRRSVTAAAPVTDQSGAPFGDAVIGFARVARRAADPVKPTFDLAVAVEWWASVEPIEVPLRDAAGVVTLDPARGRIAIEPRADLANPAGALQGAMVALAVEAAAEDLAEHLLGRPQVVYDLDIRFLGQGRVGPITSEARVAAGAGDAIRVDLTDGQGKRVAVAYARAGDPPD